MAAGATYEPIATNTLGSAQSSVTFSSISGSYTDLILIMSVLAESNLGGQNAGIRFNGDTGSNYSATWIYANGVTAPYSERQTNVTSIGRADFYTTTVPMTTIISINNYSNSTTYKTALIRSNESSNGTRANVGLWRNTAAINQITVIIDGGNFGSGSIFTLYGITKA